MIDIVVCGENPPVKPCDLPQKGSTGFSEMFSHLTDASYIPLLYVAASSSQEQTTCLSVNVNHDKFSLGSMAGLVEKQLV